jgi:hypothetical protein
MFWVFACWIIGVWNVEGVRVLGSFDSFGILDILVLGIVLGTWDPRSWRLGEFSTWNLEGVRVFGFWGRFIFQLKAKSYI